jgi:hypothetical protein
MIATRLVAARGCTLEAMPTDWKLLDTLPRWCGDILPSASEDPSSLNKARRLRMMAFRRRV